MNLWRIPNENGGALEKDEADEDGLSVATLDQRVDKTVSVSAWYMKIMCFAMNDSECSGKFKAQSDLKQCR